MARKSGTISSAEKSVTDQAAVDELVDRLPEE